ncbi:MAG: ABC transporter permease subunit [Flavobacteriaceae bacterium]
MWPVFLKEIRTVFSDAIGFLSIGLFLVLNSLFLWVLDSPINMIQAGFADLTLFFELAPWLLLLVVPALAMRSFSEEIKSGTLEIVLTKPLQIAALVVGKYLGLMAIGLLALLPTLGYIYLLKILMPDTAQLDWGMIYGGYLGLILFLSMLAAIGLFLSSLTRQQTTAFLMALAIGFFQFYLWGQIAALSSSFFWYDWIASIGMQAHYSSLNRGVILIGDISYFVSGTFLFLLATQFRIQSLQSQ